MSSPAPRNIRSSTPTLIIGFVCVSVLCVCVMYVILRGRLRRSSADIAELERQYNDATTLHWRRMRDIIDVLEQEVSTLIIKHKPVLWDVFVGRLGTEGVESELKCSTEPADSNRASSEEQSLCWKAVKPLSVSLFNGKEKAENLNSANPNSRTTASRTNQSLLNVQQSAGLVAFGMTGMHPNQSPSASPPTPQASHQISRSSPGQPQLDVELDAGPHLQVSVLVIMPGSRPASDVEGSAPTGEWSIGTCRASYPGIEDLVIAKA